MYLPCANNRERECARHERAAADERDDELEEEREEKAASSRPAGGALHRGRESALRLTCVPRSNALQILRLPDLSLATISPIGWSARFARQSACSMRRIVVTPGGFPDGLVARAHLRRARASLSAILSSRLFPPRASCPTGERANSRELTRRISTGLCAFGGEYRPELRTTCQRLVVRAPVRVDPPPLTRADRSRRR